MSSYEARIAEAQPIAMTVTPPGLSLSPTGSAGSASTLAATPPTTPYPEPNAKQPTLWLRPAPIPIRRTSSPHLWSKDSPALRTAYALLAAYSSLSPDTLCAHLEPGFTHEVLPLSLGEPLRTIEEFKQHAAFIFTELFAGGFEMRPRPGGMFEDKVRGTVVCVCDMIGVSRRDESWEDVNGEGNMEWKNECIIILTMREDGERVVRMQEFVDSARAVEFKKMVMEKKLKAMRVQEGAVMVANAPTVGVNERVQGAAVVCGSASGVGLEVLV